MTDVTGARVLKAVAMTVALGAAAGLSTAYVLPLLSPAWGETNRLATVIVLEVYLAVVVAHLAAFGGYGDLRIALRLCSTTSRELLAAFAVLVAAWVVAIVAYLILSPFAWAVADVRTALWWVGADGGRLADADPLLFLLAAGRATLVAPLAEELLFRGSLFGWLRSRWSAPAAILLTSALFAMAHPMPVLWPVAFLIGVAAASFRERSGSITPFVVMHIINNIALVGFSYWVTGWHVPDLLGSEASSE
jgi:membrane protease YdiL (CAAX protease family)